ncbi:MAG: C cytochrome precursor [Planctomycetes bacterium]|nr:C cytochrome precursor [Planctomycetota bacterium]
MIEASFVVVAGLAAVVPLWRQAGLGCRVLAALSSAFVLAIAASSLGWGSGGSASMSVPPAADLDTRGRPLIHATGGYTGSGACRSCHPGEHASWSASYHRTMTQVVTRQTVVDRFESKRLDWFGEPVSLEWRGDRLWVDFQRGGGQPLHVQAPVVQATGSHQVQVLWYSTGNERELAPVPMCFKLAERMWIPLNTVFVLPPEYREPPEPGTWNQNCQMCHATDVRPRVDIDRCDTEVSELGIACEACHGPGAEHVAANGNPWRRYATHLAGSGDDTVVDPARLPRPRSAQVCGQCHSVNVLREEHFDRWRENGLVYRPGDELRDSNLIVDPGSRFASELRRTLQHNPKFFASAFWSDGQIRLSGREYNGLVTSPCYTRGSGERQLDCISCHELHDARGPDESWRDDMLGVGMRGNAACTQCHEELTDAEALGAHSHHAPQSSGSNCYNCHMSHTSFGLMKAMRSHTITSPSVQVELATGRPNACNQCHLDRTLAWTNEQLQQGWGVAPAALDDDQRDIAASVRWLLTGDAGQRALAAWSMGWSEAQAASGRDWLAPYLARLLDDPYHVVRFGAFRSLRSLGVGAELGGYDFLADAAKVGPFVDAVQASWRSGYRGEIRPALLIEAGGALASAFARLYALRDDRPVYLAE